MARSGPLRGEDAARWGCGPTGGGGGGVDCTKPVFGDGSSGVLRSDWAMVRRQNGAVSVWPTGAAVVLLSPTAPCSITAAPSSVPGCGEPSSSSSPSSSSAAAGSSVGPEPISDRRSSSVGGGP